MVFRGKCFCADILKLFTAFIVLFQMVRKICTAEILVDFDTIIWCEEAKYNTIVTNFVLFAHCLVKEIDGLNK